MAWIQCSKCKKQFSDRTAQCPHCKFTPVFSMANTGVHSQPSAPSQTTQKNDKGNSPEQLTTPKRQNIESISDLFQRNWFWVPWIFLTVLWVWGSAELDLRSERNRLSTLHGAWICKGPPFTFVGPVEKLHIIELGRSAMERRSAERSQQRDSYTVLFTEPVRLRLPSKFFGITYGHLEAMYVTPGTLINNDITPGSFIYNGTFVDRLICATSRSFSGMLNEDEFLVGFMTPKSEGCEFEWGKFGFHNTVRISDKGDLEISYYSFSEMDKNPDGYKPVSVICRSIAWMRD